MEMSKRIIIGIDPDNQKSGMAVIGLPEKSISVYKLDFPTLISVLKTTSGNHKNVEVIIEGGWLNSSNWHTLNYRMSKSMAAEIGRRTGMNHQTGILIAEMCKDFGMNVQVVKPLKKYWKGKDGKITQEEATYFMGELPRMNQDQRDALLLAWVYAGLTVKVKPITKRKCAKSC